MFDRLKIALERGFKYSAGHWGMPLPKGVLMAGQTSDWTMPGSAFQPKIQPLRYRMQLQLLIRQVAKDLDRCVTVKQNRGCNWVEILDLPAIKSAHFVHRLPHFPRSLWCSSVVKYVWETPSSLLLAPHSLQTFMTHLTPVIVLFGYTHRS